MQDQLCCCKFPTADGKNAVNFFYRQNYEGHTYICYNRILPSKQLFYASFTLAHFYHTHFLRRSDTFYLRV